MVTWVINQYEKMQCFQIFFYIISFSSESCQLNYNCMSVHMSKFWILQCFHLKEKNQRVLALWSYGILWVSWAIYWIKINWFLKSGTNFPLIRRPKISEQVRFASSEPVCQKHRVRMRAQSRMRRVLHGQPSARTFQNWHTAA